VIVFREEDCLWLDCCFDVNENSCYHPDSTFECLELGGKCVPLAADKNQCNRGIIENDVYDICPPEKYCCKDCQTPECKIEDEQWQSEDGECALVDGTCLFDTMGEMKVDFIRHHRFF